MYKFKKLFNKYNYDEFIDEYKSSNDAIKIYKIKEKISIELLIEVKKYFLENYKYIVLYHATATDNINSFLEKGLLLSSVDRIIGYARKLFNENEYPEITEKKFSEAVNRFLEDTDYIKQNENKIYFSLDDEVLKEESSSHYLLFGGETLGCLIQEIGLNYAIELKKKLKPIIFKCKVNISLLDDEDIEILVENIVIRYLENLTYVEKKFPLAEFTPYITSPLDSASILSCEFPQKIKCSHPLLLNF